MGVGSRGLSWRRQLLAAGYTDRELRRLRRAGELGTVRRGAYVGGGSFPADAAARHALLIAAALPELSAGAVVSHASAAVLHGLPLWSVPLGRVHVTRPRRSGGRIGRVAHLHSAPLDADEVVITDGVAVTSPTRTVVDLARAFSFEAAVVTADAALRLGLVDRAGLDAAVARAGGWRGSPAARRVVAFADGRAESVGESRSRVALARAGLPTPVPQWEVRCGGVLVARVDFGWPEFDTVGEFDGRIKYGRLLRPGQQPGDAVFTEKLREDQLRDLGLHVRRWTWTDLDTFAPVAARLTQALHRP